MTRLHPLTRHGRWAMTGAAGNVGHHLRGALAERFEHLLLLDTAEISDCAPHESAVRADLRDFALLRDVLTDLDGIIHLGGIPDEADFHDLVDVNITGSFHVLEAARINRVPRVVYASSNRATGFYPTTQSVNPDLPVRPDGLYGVSKAAVEALGRLYADKFGLQVACLRIGSFEPAPSTPRELATWLSPDDCTRAFRAALDADYGFVTFYAVSDNRGRWWDLEAGRAIGFDPRNDAAEVGTRIAGSPTEPQGGDFASPGYTLSRQRHLSNDPTGTESSQP
ncbi:NAD(P)-dependent oxidoreductase [Streptomyces sp. NPDC052051]|uniref:NAD-dependent epimerase/dehydratase family protein n=1 Tax=Streptomyces sp. NPDC052051 TaxID=3154649 RepID=UPI00342289CC